MRLKKGDTYPFQQRLQYDDKTPVDLTDAESVNLRLRLDGSSTFTVDKPCVIVDPTSGLVQYSPEDEDTAIPGMYIMEYLITYLGGRIQTVPSNNTMWLLILGEADD
ncbi:MAG: phage baseplate upper protein [Bacteroidales bacterium]|jgi:hypothetical protein|nr:phage baseplate upper protein [Bacteroidales bacterium]